MHSMHILIIVMCSFIQRLLDSDKVLCFKDGKPSFEKMSVVHTPLFPKGVE
jgi:hypothetical protein